MCLIYNTLRLGVIMYDFIENASFHAVTPGLTNCGNQRVQGRQCRENEKPEDLKGADIGEGVWG